MVDVASEFLVNITIFWRRSGMAYLPGTRYIIHPSGVIISCKRGSNGGTDGGFGPSSVPTSSIRGCEKKSVFLTNSKFI